MFKKIGSTFVGAFQMWHKENPALLSAGISYFTLFSIIPAMVIFIAVAGRVFSVHLARPEIFDKLSNLLSPDAAEAIQGFFYTASRTAIPATFFGVALLVWGSTRAFSSIQLALNIMMGAAGKSKKVRHLLADRVKAFMMMLGVGLLLVIFFALDFVWAYLKHGLREFLPPMAVRILMVSASYALFLGLFILLFGMIFKFLPDVRVVWKEVWPGAVVSAVMFALARYLIALYFSFSMLASLYGAAGSVMVLLVWIHSSTQILLFGAAFTRAWSAEPPTAKSLFDGVSLAF